MGDVVGRPGRDILRAKLPALRRRYSPDFIVVNAENAAGGTGLTPALADEFFSYGIHCLTLGNHAWDKREIAEYIDGEPRLIRPLNWPPGTPGAGVAVVQSGGKRLGVVNLHGRVFAGFLLEDPFRAADAALEYLQAQGVSSVLVDFHAEATSEKQALGWYLDGRASAVVGTHTHVQTADAVVLPGGTAYITDVGMNGPRHSVIGMNVDLVLERFLTQMPVRLEVAKGPAILSGVAITLDDTGRAMQIESIFEGE